MSDLKITVTPHRVDTEHTVTSFYYSQYEIADALHAIFDGIDRLSGLLETEILVEELMSHPAFCALAAAVHELHVCKKDNITDIEAIDRLIDLRDAQQPIAITKRAGNELIQIARSRKAS